MFYAIEYAYGSHVINNGPGGRADKIYKFKRAVDRDAFVDAGNQYQGPGERKKLTPNSHQANIAEEYRTE